MPSNKWKWLTVLLLSAIVYVWIGYFTKRTDFPQLVILYFILFAFYVLILWRGFLNDNIKYLIGAAIFLRLCLFLMTPNFSDDYFRFVWDGLLSAHGYNPYLILPSNLINSQLVVPGINQALFSGLNSPNYYTIYPPLCELIFGLSARLCGSNIFANVVFLRFVILLSECGSLVLLYKLTQLLHLPAKRVLIYAFNPLVIIELTGNLHFEAIMIFFILLAVYLLVKQKNLFSAPSFAGSIGAKLVPAIFFPFFIKRIGIRKSVIYALITVATLALISAPFLNVQAISNFITSFRLYFQTFEFNASIYYVARWIGYLIKGYNMIAIAGPVLAIISFLGIIGLAVFETRVTWKSLFTALLFALTIYFAFSTTVHPWYITTLVMLSVFSRFRYALLWSLLIILSYSAYQTVPYAENLWLVGAEYLLVYGFLIYEVLKAFRSKKLNTL